MKCPEAKKATNYNIVKKYMTVATYYGVKPISIRVSTKPVQVYSVMC
jgi:hypothetical protein